MVTTVTTNHSVWKCMSEIPSGYGNYGNYEPLCSEVYVEVSPRLQ